MKKVLFLSLLITTLFACEKSETKSSKFDYSVLGLEQLVINNETIALGTNGIPNELFKSQNIGLTGTHKGDTDSSIRYRMMVVNKMWKSLNINVKSIYDDVQYVVEQQTTEEHTIYSVTISRTGYDEQINYWIIINN